MTRICTMTTTDQHGDELITTTTTVDAQPLHVLWADIRDSVRVEYDEWHEAPWDWCDGFDHEMETIDDDGQREARGYYKNQRIIIEPDKNLYDWHRARGASKQVGAEMVAADRQRRLDQLTTWYTDGWEWWQVVGEFRGYSASVGGVDSYEYANHLIDEMAEEIAAQMTADGYQVTDRPKRPSGPYYHRQLDSQSWRV